MLSDRDAPTFIRKGGPDRPRTAALVPIVEVVDVVVVEVDSLLDQPEAEPVEVEIKVRLRVVDRCGDVV
jgi:hypothetical protein